MCVFVQVPPLERLCAPLRGGSIAQQHSTRPPLAGDMPTLRRRNGRLFFGLAKQLIQQTGIAVKWANERSSSLAHASEMVLICYGYQLV